MQQIEYQANLVARGCEKLGSGCYGAVYSIPGTDKVIKVGSQDQWPDYIVWATRNGYAGNFAPKVYSLKFKSFEGHEYYVAIMERLVCTIGQMKLDPDDNYRSVSAPQIKLHSQIENWLGQPDADRSPDLVQATDLLEYVKALRLAKFTGDCHSSNVMVRHDGSLVVTDPVSYSDTGTRFRIRSGHCL